MKLPRPRVLPFAIALTVVGIGMRTVDLVSIALSAPGFATLAPAAAASSDSTPASGKSDAKSGDAKAGDAKPGDAKGDASGAPAKMQVATAESPMQGQPSHPPIVQSDDGRAETELLQSLVEKRKALEARAHELDEREALMKAAENRVDKKVDELSGMRSDLEKLLDIQKTKDDAQMASLVKIYENMKPKDAAQIFDALELPVLVDVSARMKEAKLAPVLGDMQPERARVLTVKLAEHRRVMEGAVADAKEALGSPTPATEAVGEAINAAPAENARK